MRRKFTNQNINQLGYTDNTNTAYNNYNVIPSNNITMQNTSVPVVGQGLDQYGNQITQPIVMQPGQNYQFQNAAYVEETPQFQAGGFYLNPQTIQMLQQMNTGSQIPTNQQLDWATTNQITQPGYNNPNVGTFDVPITAPAQQPFNNNVQVSSGINEWNQAYLTGEGQPQGYSNSYNVPTITGDTSNTTSNTNQENTSLGRFQFYNPYGGYNVENASFQLGQGIESGNTLQTIGSGLKILTGLGRNVLSGLGFQRQNEQIMEEYRRQQRNALTQNNRPQYLQNGGEVQAQQQQLVEGVVQALQQGIQPEEVLQALIQQGLDQQTATELIQAVMQQLQTGPEQPTEQQAIMKNGGKYLDMMRGKKIKNYTFNEETGNYTVEFE